MAAPCRAPKTSCTIACFILVVAFLGQPAGAVPTSDVDSDGIINSSDNCPTVGNPGQEDRDGDQRGDACDWCSPAMVQELTMPIAAYAQFGMSLAVDGEIAVVGAPSVAAGGLDAVGKAFVYVHRHGVWTLATELSAPDVQVGARFGASVAVSGPFVAVGAPGLNVNATASVGSVYVYNGSGENWALQTRLTPSSIAANQNIGSKLALDGSTLVATVAGQSAPLQRAHVFERTNGAWSEKTILPFSPHNRSVNARDVAVSGDRILIGATGLSSPAPPANPGHADVFARVDGIWRHEAELENANGWSDYGSRVDLDGSTAIVTEYDAIHAFSWTPSGWVPTETLAYLSQTWSVTQVFGVDFKGNRAIGSMSDYDCTTNPCQYINAAVVLARSRGQWAEQARFIAEEAPDWYSPTAAITRDYVFVAAPSATVAGQPNAGRVRVWRLNCILDVDADVDGDVDEQDYGEFVRCLQGPFGQPAADCGPNDLNDDDVIDLADFAIFQRWYTGLLP